ncbi:hypothetical protein Skr01_69480 [Sphaerisporangium krabiense]|uniref:Uncharacterized protein n=1 Tax=Sphaerisporangium krabiense TaxID=763782 RepID=A0A7W8Z6I3_9ACTN|nr:hypothetical protein [Sphaerisporangium krabiense]MBB5628398.1 hypothetical protein [Sphaerisporangium krabiense]GII66863.1 hypothetical protein Skr01_69480 [Sphaerisporangium krabiense]
MALSVVYVADTGHVAGALALTGAGAPADVAAVVGAELPLRVSLGEGRVASLPLSVRRLALAPADDEPGVFGGPLAFGVELTSDGRAKPALARLAPWTTPLSLAKDRLTVVLPVAATRLTPVLALLSDGRETHVAAGEIPPGGDRAELPVALDSGPHGVLVLVTGITGRLEKLNVP